MLLLHGDYCCSSWFVFNIKKREGTRVGLGHPVHEARPQMRKAGTTAPFSCQWHWRVFFYFAVSVPQVFIPQLNIILRLEHESCFSWRCLGRLLILFFSLSQVLSVTWRRQRKHEYKGFCPLWLWSVPGGEMRAALQHPVSKGDPLEVPAIGDQRLTFIPPSF